MRLIAERLLPEENADQVYVDDELISKAPEPLLPPRAGRAFHVAFSEHNPGARELLEEWAASMDMAFTARHRYCGTDVVVHIVSDEDALQGKAKQMAVPEEDRSTGNGRLDNCFGRCKNSTECNGSIRSTVHASGEATVQALATSILELSRTIHVEGYGTDTDAPITKKLHVTSDLQRLSECEHM